MGNRTIAPSTATMSIVRDILPLPLFGLPLKIRGQPLLFRNRGCRILIVKMKVVGCHAEMLRNLSVGNQCDRAGCRPRRRIYLGTVNRQRYLMLSVVQSVLV